MKKLSCISLFIGITFFGLAQKYSFINYSAKQGLPQSQVLDIKQDQKGYLWIATMGGLSKFDGVNFVNFGEKEGLISNRVFSLSLDKENNIWAVTKRGVSVLKNDSIVDFEFNEKLEEAEIIEIIHHRERMWIATEQKGIFCFKKPTSTSYELQKIIKAPLEGAKVKDLYLDGEKIYVATSIGLFQLWNNNITEVPIPGNKNLMSVGITQYGKIWLATATNGVYFIEKNKGIHINQENSSLLNNYIINLMVDNEGKAWVTSNSCLSEINQQGEVENYSSNNGFEDQSQVVFQDNEGNIWVGTNGKGLFKFANKQFKYLTRQKNLPADLIISIGEDRQGNIWLGSLGEGVSCITPNGINSYNAKQTNFPNNICWAIHQDLNKKMWFGTSEGLAYFSGNKFITYTEKDGLPDNKVQSIFQEVPEVMWVGTRNGVAYYKNGMFNPIINYEYQNTRSIVSTQDGVYWFGTSDGLVKYDGFESKLIEDSLLKGITIYCMVSIGNNLWIGTEKGLVFFNTTSFEKVDYSNDGEVTAINFLKIDPQNKLWIGANNGIYELDYEEFLRGKKTINSYTTNNGLVGMETNLNAVCLDSKNNLWMGTSEGVNVYKRADINQAKEFVPSVHFTNIKLFFEEKNWLKQFSENPTISFGHKRNTFTFYFHSNYFKDPTKVRYSYFLEGFDEEWSPMEKINFSRYPNLPHGNYTFKIKSTIDGKNWSEIEDVSFTIKTPYWLSMWFISLVLIALFFIFYLLYNRRRKAIKKAREVELLNYKNKLIKLEQQSLNASMNRHFIFNSLNSIQFYINKEDKLSANRYLSNFSKLIRKNLDSSSAEDGLIPLSEEIERLSLYLSLESMRFKEKFTYEINIDSQVEAEMTQVPAMFMQPFVENSIWHGILPMEVSGKITIDIFKKNNKTYFEIMDNGIGIETSIKNKSQEQNEHSSKGMKIATNRIELLQKVIEKEITIKGPFQLNENGKVLGTKVVVIFG